MYLKVQIKSRHNRGPIILHVCLFIICTVYACVPLCVSLCWCVSAVVLTINLCCVQTGRMAELKSATETNLHLPREEPQRHYSSLPALCQALEHKEEFIEPNAISFIEYFTVCVCVWTFHVGIKRKKKTNPQVLKTEKSWVQCMSEAAYLINGWDISRGCVVLYE